MPPDLRKPPRSPFDPPTPQEDPPSPIGFAQVDPMAAQPLSSPPAPRGRTIPPLRSVGPAASSARASGPSSPATSSAASTTTTPTTSSPASFDAAKFRRIFRELVGALGAFANEKLTRDSLARDHGLWLTDDHDQADIGDPLGLIVVRHLGLAKLKNVEDLEDLVNLAAAAAAYVSANVRKVFEIGKARRLAKLAAHVVPPPETEPTS